MSEREFAFSQGRGKRAWVRTQNYKLYDHGKYYNVSKDPGEKSSLTETSGESAAVRKRLESALRKLGLPRGAK